MKRHLCILTIASLVGYSLVGLAQATASSGETPATVAQAADTSATPPPATNNTNAVAAGTNAAPATPDATNAAPASADANAASTNAAVAVEATAPATPADAKIVDTNNVPAAPVIPLIVMDDVPLTDAIKNLARQAGLNYMLDPKIAYGQIGPDGKPIPQPSVSIRWENVTAEQALMALLGNYGLQLAEDPRSKIARITIKDPTQPDPLVTKIFQLKYASAPTILTNVQATLTDKRAKVVADVRTSQLVVLSTEKELATVEDLIEHLDTPTKQVLIETRLVETSINPSTIKGVDWTGTLQGQHVAFGNNLQQNSSSVSLNNTLSQTLPKLLVDTSRGFNPATAFLDADGVNAVVSFLNTYSDAKVLSTPRTVTLDNELAEISVTRATPIINVTAGTANTTGGSQISYTNLGVILHVVPRISANNFVNLRVVPEVSRKFDTVTKNLGQAGLFQADEYDIRKLETRVMIPSGNTLVLGGLVQDEVNTSNTKVPVLGDIPVIGYAFRSDSKSRQKNNLIIFITPTIVQDEDYQPTKTDFMKSPVPLKDNIEGEWSAWDSGQPKDWSKPHASSNQ